jgi:hypothetical protein
MLNFYSYVYLPKPGAAGAVEGASQCVLGGCGVTPWMPWLSHGRVCAHLLVSLPGGGGQGGFAEHAT